MGHVRCPFQVSVYGVVHPIAIQDCYHWACCHELLGSLGWRRVFYPHTLHE